MLSHSRTIHVEFGDCDPSGIVFHPHYFAWFDASVHGLLRAAGTTLEDLVDEFQIAGIPLAETRLKFHLPARQGDTLQLTTEVTAIHRCAFDLQHRLLKDGILAAEGSETRVWTAFDPAQARVRAQALPQRMLRLLSGQAGRR